MPAKSKARQRAEELLALGLMVVGIGGGWYLVDAPYVDSELAFVDVGWWNIRDLSSHSRNDTEIKQIAAVIDGPDVMAVGEVNDTSALDRLAAELGPGWSWAATRNKIGRTTGSSEYYGFLWNSARVRMVDTISVDPDPGDLIDRDPAWATFRTVDDRFDFTVIAAHITWSGGVAARKAEIRRMQEVWRRTNAATTGDNDLILVGDFNRDIGDDSFDSVLALPGMMRANTDMTPTKINSDATYDQIFLSLDETREWTGEFYVSPFDEDDFNDDDKAASLAVSDHRPVWISLYIPEVDDD